MAKLCTHKKLTLSISIFVFLIIGLALYLYYPIYFMNTGEQSLINEYNSETSLFSSDRNSPLKDGWEGNLRLTSKYEVVLTSNNPFNPRFSYVTEQPYGAGVRVLFLEREGLGFNFNMADFRAVSLKNTSFQEAIEIARKYDLSKENPDPENITVYEPPTKEEIQEQKEITDFKNSPEFSDYQTELKACYDTYLASEETEEDLIKQGECIIEIEEKYER